MRHSRGQCHCPHTRRGTLSHFTLRPHMRRGDAALLCRRTAARRATAHGGGAAVLHLPDTAAGAGSGGKPHPRKVGPPPTGLGLPPFVNRGRLPEPKAVGSPSHARSGRRPCRAARHPPSAGAVAHGVGTAARRPPGPSPAWGWDCRPSSTGADCRSRKRREAPPTQGRAVARVGLARRPSPAGPPPTGLGLPPFVNRGRLPEPEAAGSPSHARPGRRPCRVSASPAARRGRCPRGWDCRPSPAGPDCRRRKRREASPTQGRAAAHGVGTAALRQPGQTAGAGSGGKPLPRKAGPPPV